MPACRMARFRAGEGVPTGPVGAKPPGGGLATVGGDMCAFAGRWSIEDHG